MPWTATLIGADDRETHWKITVEFTDGTRTEARAFRFTGSTVGELAAFVRNKALSLEKTDPFDLLPLVGRSIDVTPPTQTEPTQAEIDRAAWLSDYHRLQRMIRVTEAIPALMTTQVIAAIASLRSSLASGWRNSYLDNV